MDKPVAHSEASKASVLSRRAFLRLTGRAAIAGLLSGCTRGSPATAPGEEPVQLVYQDWRTDWFPLMAQRMLEQFNLQHPGIRAFYVPDPEDFQEKMLADFQAGTAADVFQGCCAHFPTWAQKGYTLDLHPYVQRDIDRATIDDWDGAQYRALFTRDGKQFGLPKYHGALALYYNRDLFDERSVAYPDTEWDHEAYRQAMERLTLDQSDDGQTDVWGSMLDISWDRIQVHVNGWGGRFVDSDDPTHCLMCSTEAMQAMEWLQARMWNDRVMATPLDVQSVATRQAFIEQRVAMVEDGSWALKDILAGSKFRIGIAPFPAGPARRVTLATTDGFGIYAGTKHPNEAWELLEFLVSKDYGRAMAQANFLQPARASLVDDWVGYVRDEFPEEAQDVDIAVFAQGQLQGYSVTTEVFANMGDAARLAGAAWEEIFTLGQSPVTRMQEACNLIQTAQEG